MQTFGIEYSTDRQLAGSGIFRMLALMARL
jgi:hypothetical protein